MTFDASQKLENDQPEGPKLEVTSLCVLAGSSSSKCSIVAGVTQVDSSVEAQPYLAVFEICWPTPAATVKSTTDQSGSTVSTHPADKKVGGGTGTTKKVMPPSLMHHVIVANHHQGSGALGSNSVTAPG